MVVSLVEILDECDEDAGSLGDEREVTISEYGEHPCQQLLPVLGLVLSDPPVCWLNREDIEEVGRDQTTRPLWAVVHWRSVRHQGRTEEMLVGDLPQLLHVFGREALDLRDLLFLFEAHSVPMHPDLFVDLVPDLRVQYQPFFKVPLRLTNRPLDVRILVCCSQSSEEIVVSAILRYLADY